MLPLIAEPAELEPLLEDSRLLVVDLCSETSFARAHIPGALHVNPRELLAGIPPAVGKLASPPALSRLFSRLGLTTDRHVLAYDDEGGGWAGRFLWTLEVTGHTRYSYLNGGLVSWIAERRRLQHVSQPAVPAMVEVSIHRSAIAEKEDVLEAIKNQKTILWDARSAEEYAGKRVMATRSGHIPGAINLDWQDTMDRRASLRIRNDIAQLLEETGIVREQPVITYCQSHHRSGLTWLIGKFLNYDIRAYHGSWSEWGNDPYTPIESSS